MAYTCTNRAYTWGINNTKMPWNFSRIIEIKHLVTAILFHLFICTYEENLLSGHLISHNTVNFTAYYTLYLSLIFEHCTKHNGLFLYIHNTAIKVSAMKACYSLKIRILYSINISQVCSSFALLFNRISVYSMLAIFEQWYYSKAIQSS